MPFIMFDHDGQRVLGATGLHRPDWSVPRFEIGYWCRSSASGQGLVGEAVQALAALAFGSLQAARLEIVTDSHNERSRRVAERAGFVLEGQLRQHRRAPHGELLDTCLYGRLPAPLDGPRAWTMA
jgi:RimJ/RimL family protein N-acetyltransferase